MKGFESLIVAAAIVLTGCTGEQQRQAESTTQALATSVPRAAQNALLAGAVAAKLAGVDIDAATTVHVANDNGAIALTGQAHTASERAAYERAARSVNGVRSVRDNLTVEPRLRGLRQNAQDSALTVRVSAAIAGQAGVNVFHVSPAVKDGVVTLRGSVSAASIARTIVSTVQRVPGVKHVVDHITVSR
ncbi:MAG: BON domain-containing protein [Candidatus Baltobacteraceae bacterium]